MLPDFLRFVYPPNLTFVIVHFNIMWNAAPSESVTFSRTPRQLSNFDMIALLPQNLNLQNRVNMFV
jgi:hypothetical protein